MLLAQGLEAFDGLRPSFSAHVRWCEHGAPVEFVWSFGFVWSL
jgi:hypothetical protein